MAGVTVYRQNTLEARQDAGCMAAGAGRAGEDTGGRIVTASSTIIAGDRADRRSGLAGFGVKHRCRGLVDGQTAGLTGSGPRHPGHRSCIGDTAASGRHSRRPDHGRACSRSADRLGAARWAFQPECRLRRNDDPRLRPGQAITQWRNSPPSRRRAMPETAWRGAEPATKSLGEVAFVGKARRHGDF